MPTCETCGALPGVYCECADDHYLPQAGETWLTMQDVIAERDALRDKVDRLTNFNRAWAESAHASLTEMDRAIAERDVIRKQLAAVTPVVAAAKTTDTARRLWDAGELADREFQIEYLKLSAAIDRLIAAEAKP
jgi:hypothetical protein